MLAVQRFTVTGAIDGAFRLYRANFKALFILSFIVSVPGTVASLIIDVLEDRVSRMSFDFEDGNLGPLVALGVFGALFLLTLLVSVVAGMFGMAATTRIASVA